jgi:hypothetical protein
MTRDRDEAVYDASAGERGDGGKPLASGAASGRSLEWPFRSV